MSGCEGVKRQDTGLNLKDYVFPRIGYPIIPGKKRVTGGYGHPRLLRVGGYGSENCYSYPESRLFLGNEYSGMILCGTPGHH